MSRCACSAFLADLLEEQRTWHAKASFRAVTSGGAMEPAPERRVLVVGHATTNRILISVALGIDLRGYRRRFVQGQANLTVLALGVERGARGRELLLAQRPRAPPGAAGHALGVSRRSCRPGR